MSAVTLSAEESAALYGAPLASQRIQPVWIEVENRDDRPYFLLSPGLDPSFYPASEAAEAMAQGDPDRLTELERRFRGLAFHNPVPPGATVSGFVLTNLDEAVKVVQLDLVASGRARSFSMFTAVPGFRGDYHASGVFKRELYTPGQIVNYTDDAAFRAALEALPCCATNKDGSKKGDPLNLVVVGGLDDAFPALVRRGWRPTEETWSGSIMRMASSVLSGERYPYAPVSNLYLFGRSQDLALQKARDNIHQRNHLRLWLSPMLYHGKTGLGRPDQPRHRQPPHHPYAYADHAQDRSRRGRGARRAPGGHGLFSEPRQDGAGGGRRRRGAQRAARKPHHRPVLHRRAPQRAGVRPPADFARRDRDPAVAWRSEMT